MAKKFHSPADAHNDSYQGDKCDKKKLWLYNELKVHAKSTCTCEVHFPTLVIEDPMPLHNKTTSQASKTVQN